MPNKDFYEILGVSENASESDIKRAYRALAKKFHPDANQSDKTAEMRFKDISEAYSVLSNAERRQQYDQMRRLGAFGGGNGFNFNDFRNTRGNPNQTFSGGGASSIFEEFMGSDGFGNIFGSMFERSGSGKRSGARAQKGQDLAAEVEIPFELAISGGSHTFSLRMIETCPACNGSGTRQSYTCPDCIGSGRIDKTKKYTIKISPGIDSGAKMRLKGQGNPGVAGGAAGDLLVNIKVSTHPDFRREGLDVYSEVTINIIQASLGTAVKVTTLSGKTVELKIPAGTQPGRSFRLKEMGIQGNSGTGDHFVRVNVSTPEKLSRKSKELLINFAREAKLDF
jgi:molecular chaperone DnaJ